MGNTKIFYQQETETYSFFTAVSRKKRKAKALKESRYKLNARGSSEDNKIDKLKMAGKQYMVPAFNDQCGSEIIWSIKCP